MSVGLGATSAGFSPDFNKVSGPAGGMKLVRGEIDGIAFGDGAEIQSRLAGLTDGKTSRGVFQTLVAQSGPRDLKGRRISSLSQRRIAGSKPEKIGDCSDRGVVSTMGESGNFEGPHQDAECFRCEDDPLTGSGGDKTGQIR